MRQGLEDKSKVLMNRSRKYGLSMHGLRKECLIIDEPYNTTAPSAGRGITS